VIAPIYVLVFVFLSPNAGFNTTQLTTVLSKAQCERVLPSVVKYFNANGAIIVDSYCEPKSIK